MDNLGRWSTLILGGALAVAPALQARTCTGNGDLIGSYGWVGSRSAQFVPPPVVVDPAVTTAVTPVVTPITGSSTSIGGLAAGAANSAAFAQVGRVFVDGNGGIFASSSPTSILLQVGKYTANTDCTISVSITDVFATPGEAFLTPVQATATFEGLVVQNGNELDLTQTGTGNGTVLTLRRTKLSGGCSTDMLGGPLGLTATGVATAAPVGTAKAVATPFNLYARLVADGAGNFVSDTFGLLSPLVARQLTGTYTINGDCTGAATLTASDGKSRKINFVVVASGPGSAQALLFAFTDAGVLGGGLAQQQ